LPAYEGPMFALLSHRQPFSPSLVSRSLVSSGLAALALLVLGAGLSGCASVGDYASSAFADPAKYDLYECKQLEPERRTLAIRAAELQGLMAKAETGVAGSVVSEMAYRNDVIAVHGQQKLAEEAWRRNKCHEAKPEARPAAVAPVVAPAPPAVVRGSRAPSKSGSAVY
jgi:hypothetical protein